MSKASTNNLLVVEDLRSDVAKLANVISGLSSSDQNLLKTVSVVKTSLDSSRENISKAAVQAKQTKFDIRINSFPGGEELEKELRDLDISASFDKGGPARSNPDKYLTISIGRNVPLEIVTQTVQLAKRAIPELSFASISERETMENSIAVGYLSLSDTKPFSKDDFEYIVSSKSISDLHEKIIRVREKNTIKNETEKSTRFTSPIM